MHAADDVPPKQHAELFGQVRLPETVFFEQHYAVKAAKYWITLGQTSTGILRLRLPFRKRVCVVYASANTSSAGPKAS